MINVMDECNSVDKFNAECANRQMRYIGIDVQNVTHCMDNSFISRGDLTSDNKIFRKDREWSTKLGVVMHPSITINNITYRGEITGYDIFRAICAGF